MPDGSDRAECVTVDSIADEDDASLDDVGDTQEKVGGGAIVDGYEHHTFEHASPKRDQPLRAVLRPNRDRLALADAFGTKAIAKCARGRGDIGVAVRPTPIPIVVNHEFAGRRREIRVEIEKSAARHSLNYD